MQNLEKLNQKSREELIEYLQILQDETSDLQLKLKKKNNELHILHEISCLIEKPGLSLDVIFQDIVNLILKSWHYPEITCVRIQTENKEFKTDNFRATEWKLFEIFSAEPEVTGVIEVYSSDSKSLEEETHFLQERRTFLKIIAGILSKTITEKYLAEELKYSNDKFLISFKKSPIAKCIISKTDNFSVIDFNERFLSLAGFSCEDRERCFSEVVHFFSAEILTTELLKKYSTEGELRNREIVFRNKQAEVKTALVNTETINFKAKEILIVVMHDITGLREAEDKISVNERRLQSIFNNMQDSFFQSDMSGKVYFVNPAGLKMYGVESVDELALVSSDVLCPDERSRNEIKEILHSKGTITDATIRIRRKDGTFFWGSINMQLIYDEAGVPIGKHGIVRDITERIDAEVHSEEYKLQLKNALEVAGLGFFEVSDEGRKLDYIDEKAASILDYHSDNLQGKTFLDFWLSGIHEEDLKGVLDTGERIRIGETDSALLVYRYHHPQKGWIWVKHKVEKPGNFISGDKTRALAVVQDITETKNAEIKLLENESKFRALSENSLTGVFMIENGCFRYVNHEMGKIFGYSPEEMIGKRADMIAPPEVRQMLTESYKELMKGESLSRTIETLGRRKDGVDINIQIFERFVSIDNHLVLFGNILNITKSVQNEEKLRLFSNVIKQSPVSVIVTDTNGNIEYANPFFEKLTGYNIDEYQGQNPRIQKSGVHADSLYKELWDTIKAGETWEGELYNQKKDGTFCWEKAIIFPIKNEKGDIKNFVEIKTDITESKEMTRKLVASEKKSDESRKWFEALFYTSPAYISITKLNGEYVDVNDNFLAISGHTKDELIGRLSSEVKIWVNPEDRDKLLHGLKTNGFVERMETTFRIKNNKQIYALVSAKLIERNNEQVILMVTHDVTEQKELELHLLNAKNKAEEDASNLNNIKTELEQRESLLVSIQEISHTGGWEYEIATGKSFWTPEVYQIYEVSDIENFDHLNDSLMFYENDYREKIVSALNNCINKGISYDLIVPFTSQKGNLKWGRAKAKPVFEQDKIVRVIGSFMDVTDQVTKEEELIRAKQTAEENEKAIRIQQEELQLNNERLESLLQISQLGQVSTNELLKETLEEAIKLTKSKYGYIYLYDEDTRQFTLNTWSEEVMEKCRITSVAANNNLDESGFWGEAVRQRKEIVVNNFQIDNPLKKGTPEGHVKLWNFLTIPVFVDEKIVAVAGLGNKDSDYDQSDVRQLSLIMNTVWKMLERVKLVNDLTLAREKAEESDRLKTAFLLNVSHEIRTPMNGILGFLSLLEQPELSESGRSEYIAIMNKSGERLMDTINGIVEISKIEIGDLNLNYDLVDLSEVMHYCLCFFKVQTDAKGVQFKIGNEIEGENALVKTDKHKLDSILLNLIKNAVKFTDSGKIEIGNYLKDENIWFYVSDTGKGIPADKIDKVFDSFVQADTSLTRGYEGLGIGLSIVKAYIKALNGSIEVKSEIGKGTTFLFSIPYLPEKDEVEETIPELILKEDLKEDTLLIVEDDKVNAMLLDAILKSEYKLLFAQSGDEAIEMYKRNPGISLILMDIKIPGEHNGLAVTKKIREIDQKVPIIAQTAFATETDKAKAKEAGCNDYISKPYSSVSLKMRIKNYI